MKQQIRDAIYNNAKGLLSEAAAQAFADNATPDVQAIIRNWIEPHLPAAQQIVALFANEAKTKTRRKTKTKTTKTGAKPRVAKAKKSTRAAKAAPAASAADGSEPKRKRGRPPGSKNKPKTDAPVEAKAPKAPKAPKVAKAPRVAKASQEAQEAGEKTARKKRDISTATRLRVSQKAAQRAAAASTPMAAPTNGNSAQPSLDL